MNKKGNNFLSFIYIFYINGSSRQAKERIIVHLIMRRKQVMVYRRNALSGCGLVHTVNRNEDWRILIWLHNIEALRYQVPKLTQKKKHNLKKITHLVCTEELSIRQISFLNQIRVVVVSTEELAGDSNTQKAHSAREAFASLFFILLLVSK